jgi:hypothetical protein
MPLNKKGKKIKKAMVKQYGKKKGESVFYAMENSGKLKKVKKLRGGGGYQGGRSDTPAGAAPAGDVDRSAVGAGSQYSRNKAKAALDAQRKKTVKELTPFSQSLGGKLLRTGLYLAGVPYAGTMIKKFDKPYYQKGTKPIKDIKKTKDTKKFTPTLIGDGGDNQSIIKPVAPVPVTPIEQIRRAYKKPTVSSTGEFGYSVGLRKGGMLRQGKPKLAKKGWK